MPRIFWEVVNSEYETDIIDDGVEDSAEQAMREATKAKNRYESRTGYTGNKMRFWKLDKPDFEILEAE